MSVGRGRHAMGNWDARGGVGDGNSLSSQRKGKEKQKESRRGAKETWDTKRKKNRRRLSAWRKRGACAPNWGCNGFEAVLTAGDEQGILKRIQCAQLLKNSAIFSTDSKLS